MMHSTRQGDRRVALRQRPEQRAEWTRRLGQAFPCASKFYWHGHQRHPDIAQTLVICGVTLRPLLSVGTFGGPFLGQLRDGCENFGYLQWLLHSDYDSLSLH